MKFQTAHAEVEAEGFGQTQSFSISANGKAFRGLIDGLYSRKIEAAIRELGTNAYDSHKMAGSIAPFDMHLPNALEPTFFIRDYGTGMSHEFMMSRFTVMFDSTKDGLNEQDADSDPDDQVGMLGLGRMSFFAYTDSCTITVWKDGRVNFYTVYMGPSGEPQIAHADGAESDEPTGVKVEFPVKNKDIEQFEKSAIRVLRGFPTIPNGLRDRVVEQLRVEPLEVGSFFKVYPEDYLPDGGFWAKQGCVLYPIDLMEIDDRAVEETRTRYDYNLGERVEYKHVTHSEKFAAFKNMKSTFIIDFPIGSLEFDLGRERLAYTDGTVTALKRRWNEMLADVGAKLDVHFKEAKTDWEYLCLAGSAALNSMGKLYKQTDQYAKADNLRAKLREQIAPSRKDRGPKYPIFSVVYRKAGSDYYSLVYDRDDTRIADLAGSVPEDLSKSVFVVLDGVGQHNARIGHYLIENDLIYGFTIQKADLNKALLKALGNPPLINASDLELPPRPKLADADGYERTYGGFDRIKLIDEDGALAGAENEEDYEGHLFAFINCGNYWNPDPEQYPSTTVPEIIKLHDVLQTFGGPPISFINVKKNEFDKLDRWADFPLYYGVEDTIDGLLTFPDIRDMVNIINHDRFEYTRYSAALSRWEAADMPREGEIQALARFQTRYERIPDKRRRELETHLLTYKPLTEMVITRALAYGLEVLPEKIMNRYAYPLLSNRWEKLVTAIKNINVTYQGPVKAKVVYMAMKEQIGC
ncbi:rIIA lysis inhibitor [Erythrobacter phage vB_EliS-L02]|nr:rIIA lysis inhibitor [Erythrobacter phage vB_EliS-L02]